MIVGYLAVTDNNVMREHTANSFMKAAADCIVRDSELRPCLGSTGEKFLECLVKEVEGFSVSLLEIEGFCGETNDRTIPVAAVLGSGFRIAPPRQSKGVIFSKIGVRAGERVISSSTNLRDNARSRMWQTAVRRARLSN